MTNKIIIYDDKNDLLNKIVDCVSKKVDYKFIRWQNEESQKFIEDQFGKVIFSFIIIDKDTVFVGKNAVRKFGNIINSPTLISELGYLIYPLVSNPVGILLHKRIPSDINGKYKLKDSAEVHISSL